MFKLSNSVQNGPKSINFDLKFSIFLGWSLKKDLLHFLKILMFQWLKTRIQKSFLSFNFWKNDTSRILDFYFFGKIKFRFKFCFIY